MAAFPTSLPAPLLVSHQVTPKSNKRRTDFEVGPVRNRLINKEVVLEVPVQFKFDAAQHTAFTSWYWSDAGANHGAEDFTCHWDVGFGMQQYRATFKADPVFTVIRPGHKYSVQFEVELLQL